MEKYRNEKGVFGEKEHRYRAYDKSGILDMVNSVIHEMREGNAKDSKMFQSLMPAMLQDHTAGTRFSISQRYNDFAKALGITELLSPKSLNVSV